VRTLIVGAGATGGYIGVALVTGGRDVTFLVRPATRSRLAAEGLRIRDPHGAFTATPVTAVTRDELDGAYDLVLMAVRSDVVTAAIDDILPAVGTTTRILPIINGMAHLSELTEAYSEELVLGGTARLATSLRADGAIDEVQPGTHFEIGRLDGRRTDVVTAIGAELAVPGVTVTIADDIVFAMWNKFAFITATAVLTCLLGDVIGPIARTAGGAEVARQVLAEVGTVAAAEGHPLPVGVHAALETLLLDPTSHFGPSMFRDLRAGRPVETAVLADLAQRARRHGVVTPLLDAVLVVLGLQAQRLTAARLPS
jgi:2-dehydropantoate 2-reductase